jgi:chromosome segregation ATPase
MPPRKGFKPAFIQGKGGGSMQSNENMNQGNPKRQEDLSLNDVDSFISYMNRLLEELSSKVQVCPKVDQEGNSECPFAEDLYAKKEEFSEKVEKESKKIQRYLQAVEQEIDRCSNNLERISADSRSLNGDEAKEKYAIAKRAQEAEYNKAIQQRRALTELISKTEKVLGLARAKTFPGRKPQKSFRPPLGALEGSEAPRFINGVTAARPSFKNEVDRLISLGPIGRKDR